MTRLRITSLTGYSAPPVERVIYPKAPPIGPQPSLESEPYVIALGRSGPASRVAQMDREAEAEAESTRRGIFIGLILGSLVWVGIPLFCEAVVWLWKVSR